MADKTCKGLVVNEETVINGQYDPDHLMIEASKVDIDEFIK